MKLLLVDVYCDHTNPHFRNLINGIAKEMETTFYGPGFSTEKELKMGLHKYISKYGKPDAIMVGNYLIESAISDTMGNPEMLYHWHRYTLSNYSIFQASVYCKNIMNELCEMRDTIKVIKLIRDITTMPLFAYNYLKYLLEKDFYLLCVGEDFVPEKLAGKKFGATTATNYQTRILREYHEKIVSILWLGALECNFCFTELQNRIYDWNVPGVKNHSYPQRIETYYKLKKSEFSICDKEELRPTLPYKDTFDIRWKHLEYCSLLDRIVVSFFPATKYYISSNLKEMELAGFREQYQSGLRQCKCAYVEGTDLKNFVNKYFEVPAAGTLMVGDVVKGFSAMGFKAGVNMIEASPRQIINISRKLFKEPEYMQEIANNGRNLVLKKHTLSHRAVNVKDALESIKNGEYKGSHWENGDFIIEKKQ